jgi:hypothetical protein
VKMRIVRNIHRIEVAATFVLIIAYALSCSSISRRWHHEEKPKEEPKSERFAAVELPQDSFKVAERVPDDEGGQVVSGSIDWQALDSLRRANPTVDSVTTIYRVQLYASQYFTDAGYEKDVAEDTFDEPIYLLYDVPYYKVLMGNCTSREEGERLLSQARSLGYENGWLVQSPPDSLYYKTLLPEKEPGEADSSEVSPDSQH